MGPGCRHHRARPQEPEAGANPGLGRLDPALRHLAVLRHAGRFAGARYSRPAAQGSAGVRHRMAGGTVDTASKQRDWMRGDTVVAQFVQRDSAGTQRAALSRIVARKGAQSYHLDPEQKHPGSAIDQLRPRRCDRHDDEAGHRRRGGPGGHPGTGGWNPAGSQSMRRRGTRLSPRPDSPRPATAHR